MTWTPPITWPPGSTDNAALMNANIRDNQKALISNCRAYRTTGAAVIGNSVFGFDGVTRDSQSMWSAGASTKVTVPIAGKYRITGRMGGSSTTTATLNVRKNGTTIVIAGTSGTGPLSVGEYDITLAAADYVEIWLVNVGTYTLAAISNVGGLAVDLSVQWVAP